MKNNKNYSSIDESSAANVTSDSENKGSNKNATSSNSDVLKKSNYETEDMNNDTRD